MTLFETIVAIFTILATWMGGSVESVSVVATSTTVEVVSVVDGDTIVVNNNGQKETVRYIGIDTPEPYREGNPECGSREATALNRQLVEGQRVTMVSDKEDRDKYGRLLRYVYVTKGDEQMLVNAELVKLGLARPLTIAPNVSKAKELAALASEAQNKGLGSWSLCSDF